MDGCGNDVRMIDKLDKVFSLLCQPDITQEDDTIPDRLITCLMGIMGTGGGQVLSVQQFLQIDGVCKFLNTAPASHPNRKMSAFALKVVGMIGERDEGFEECEMLWSVFNSCCQSETFTDPSVREAWFTSLASLAGRESVKLVKEIDVMDHIIACLTDPSLFVTKSAVRLLVKILDSNTVPELERERMELVKIREDIITRLMEQLVQSIGKSTALSISILSALSQCSQTVVTSLLKVDGSLELLIQCLEELSLIEAAIPLVHKVVQFARSTIPEKLEQTLIKTPQTLLQCGRVETSMKTAMELLVIFQSTDKNIREELLSFVRHPIQLLIPGGRSAVDGNWLDGKTNFIRAVISLLCRAKEMRSKQLDQVITLDEVEYILKATLHSGGNTWCRYLHGSAKVQKAGLDTMRAVLSGNTDPNMSEENVKRCVGTMMEMIESADTETGVIVKCLHVLPDFFNPRHRHQGLSETSLNLGHLCQKLLCDIRWEVRDSALMFLATITQSAVPNSTAFLQEYRLHQFIHDAMNDSDSYVRAAALNTLKVMADCDGLWKTTPEKVELIKSSIKILKTDTEGFPRRAAVAFLCHLTKRRHIPDNMMEEVNSSMAAASKDFDWEVKLGTLDFWSLKIEQALESGIKDSQSDVHVLPNYAASLYPVCETQKKKTCEREELVEKLRTLHDYCLQSLLTLLGDYDRSVRLKACQILMDLKQKCEAVGLHVNMDFKQFTVDNSQDSTLKIKEGSISCSSENMFFNENVDSVSVRKASVSGNDSDSRSVDCDSGATDSNNRTETAGVTETHLTLGSEMLNVKGNLCETISEKHVGNCSVKNFQETSAEPKLTSSTGNLSKTEKPVNGHLNSSSSIGDFLQTLLTLDLESVLKHVTMTTDEYGCHPESLLDDIISWSAESDEFMIDCY